MKTVLRGVSLMKLSNGKASVAVVMIEWERSVFESWFMVRAMVWMFRA